MLRFKYVFRSIEMISSKNYKVRIHTGNPFIILSLSISLPNVFPSSFSTKPINKKNYSILFHQSEPETHIYI